GLERQRAQAQSGASDLVAQLDAEQQRVDAASAGIQAQVNAARADEDAARRAHDEASAKLAELQARLAQEERQLRSLVKQRDAKRVEVTKAQDAAQQSVLQRALADLGVQIGDWERQRESTHAEMNALAEPIESASLALADARARISNGEREIQAARSTLEQTRRAIDAGQREQGAAIARIDGVIADKLLELGSALDGARVDAPHFAPHYETIDDTRAGVEARQQMRRSLSEARQTYDASAFRNGMFLLFGGAGLLLIIIVVLLIVLGG
ncbi:MAG: hypothetical protein KC503_04755, partial [Myxococcales bacterium]|nr:hypothetical protein [Myxococcales bacterium]